MSCLEEIECAECGVMVFRMPVKEARCAGCVALSWIEDDADRAATRAHFVKLDVIGEGVGRERARRAYRDDTWVERNCDRCGQPYRGPAVYCSIECAERDA